jgi:ABC-type multidrug transport system fused ATPase/permease subunit
VLITGFVSVVSEWFRSDLFKVGAITVTKEMRYDMYINYFAKCSKLTLQVDKEKSQKFFNMKNIEADLQIIERHIGYHKPLNQKNRLLTLAYLVWMIVVSWQISVITLSGLIGLSLFQYLTNFATKRIGKRSQSHRSKLLDISLGSFSNNISNYHKMAGQFDKINDSMYVSSYKDFVILGFCKFLQLSAGIVYACGLVMEAKKLYLNTGNPSNSHSGFKDADLEIGDIFSYSIYFVLFII